MPSVKSGEDFKSVSAFFFILVQSSSTMYEC